MPDRFPPRIAAELERAKKTGCRGISVWMEDLEAMADRAERAEATARELDIIVHDLMHVIIGMTKVIGIYAPASGIKLKADADELFTRWAAIRQAIQPSEPAEEPTDV